MASNKIIVKKTVSWLLITFILVIVGFVAQQFSPAILPTVPQQTLTKKSLSKPHQAAYELAKREKTSSPALNTKRPVPKTKVAAFIDIEISPDIFKLYQGLKIAGAEEKTWQNITFSSDPATAKISGKIKLHGWTSLASPQKSYSVKLNEPVQFAAGINLQRFFLINMVHDAGKFHGWFSYSMLQELGLFPNYFKYIIVRVNRQHQGVYLLLERTRDALHRSQPSLEFMARRRTDKVYTNKYLKTDKSSDLALAHLIQTGQTHDVQLKRDSYNALIDMEMYFSWLAYNTLVEYPDCLDELFLYQTQAEDGSLSKLKLAAWDYDQLFHPPARPENVVNSPLFSGVESELGHFVAGDQELFKRYTEKLEHLLTTSFTEQKLIHQLNETTKALHRITEFLPQSEKASFLSETNKAVAEFETKLLSRRNKLLLALENHPQ